MPEAVASNSIPMPEGQPSMSLSTLKDRFEDFGWVLETLNHMTCVVFENPEPFGRFTYGLSLIHGLVEREFRGIREAALGSFREHGNGRNLNKPLDPDLYAAVSGIVYRIMREDGRDMPEGDMSAWSDADRQEGGKHAAALYSELLAKLDDSDSLIEAASFLPWVELRARKLIGSEDSAPADRLTVMRGQFIAECIESGHSIADVAMWLGMSSEAVHTAYFKLKGDSTGRDGVPDSVRRKIERAADAS